MLPYAWAKSQRVVLCEEQGQWHAYYCEQTPAWALDEIRRQYREASFKQVSALEVENWLNNSYGQQDNAAAVMDAASNEIDLDTLMHDIPEIEDLLEASDDAPIIRMINALLTQAANQGASDIHIEAFEQHSIVRYRIDGTLRDIVRPRRALHNALISRIKIMARLDIAEKRLPQDGRISVRVGGRAIDVRVSTVPTGHGERAVLRLLDKSAGRLTLQALGLSNDHQQQLQALIRRPHGIFLVTGPTGSGKTTTLYAALDRLDANSTNILTVEDPIEYDLPGVSQIQVNPRIDLHFATALRAILRQDPDVIMIGEIRDLETAQIAIQASLTGHLVLATLHTNDAASAPTRLIDMGVEPFLLASTLQGVLAQRLIRCLCQHCKVPDQADGPAQWNPQGCTHCGHTGYAGRTGVHELLLITDDLRSEISKNSNTHEIRRLARAAGMQTLYENGLRWIDTGVSSLQELERITRED